MPPGTDIASATYRLAADDVRFLSDVTYSDKDGKRHIRQQIFDQVFSIIDNARDFIVLDFFLLNDDRGALATAFKPHRALSSELVSQLIQRKQSVPDLHVLLVTDPINDVYGGSPSKSLAALRDAGIAVVVTRLDALRDSNPLYSTIYRLLIGWWSGDGNGYGWLPNPMDSGPERVPLRSWLTLLNFKANHRKAIAADDGNGGVVAVVTSANPHDASSAHSNVAFAIRGSLATEVIRSEMEIARFSGWEPSWSPPQMPVSESIGDVEARFLTEASIARATITVIEGATNGDAIDMAMFYLSDRGVVNALVAAANRGARVRLILDPNKDAFGHAKDGVPNRPVAAEILRRTNNQVQIRWYRTQGEQFHSKLLTVRGPTRAWVGLGSANMTRRNIRNYNLEANIAIAAPTDSPVIRNVSDWFEQIWHGTPEGSGTATTGYAAYVDTSTLRYWRYRLMEATGLSTF